MNHARHYAGHVLLGLTIGVGSGLLWLHTLRAAVPRWTVAAVAVGVVFAIEWAVAVVRRRHAVCRPHRRAHARPAKPGKEAA